MIYSMTGFGRSEYSDEDRKVVIEIKSVNHRYCDISVKLPRSISRFEPELRKRLKKYVERGKVDVFVTYSNLKSSGFIVNYDKEVASQYVNHLETMKKDFELEEDIKPTVLARFPDVLKVEENYFVEDEEYEIIEKVLDEAGKQFMESRAVEGANLAENLLQKIDEIEGFVNQIEEMAPAIIEEYRTRLTEKVQALLDTAAIDENRIVQEVTIYADRVAVDEELVRLHSHVDTFRDILKNDESSSGDSNSSVGRKLDFIVQEMNREANTTLSKSDTLTVTDIGIDLKTCIEKIREQVQNIE